MKRKTVEIRISELLKGSGMTLSAAESCTGGRISHLITTVSGSSEYYLGSVTSYAVSVKESILGVRKETIEKNGVVSDKVAAEMAEGIKRVTGSTYSVATTGLAEGGDDRYPEGTVWIGVSGPAGTVTEKFNCDLGRRGNIRCFAYHALLLLETYIHNSK